MKNPDMTPSFESIQKRIDAFKQFVLTADSAMALRRLLGETALIRNDIQKLSTLSKEIDVTRMMQLQGELLKADKMGGDRILALKDKSKHSERQPA